MKDNVSPVIARELKALYTREENPLWDEKGFWKDRVKLLKEAKIIHESQILRMTPEDLQMILSLDSIDKVKEFQLRLARALLGEFYEVCDQDVHRDLMKESDQLKSKIEYLKEDCASMEKRLKDLTFLKNLGEQFRKGELQQLCQAARKAYEAQHGPMQEGRWPHLLFGKDIPSCHVLCSKNIFIDLKELKALVETLQENTPEELKAFLSKIR